MRRTAILGAVTTILLGFCALRAQEGSQATVEQYIKDSERQWAEAGMKGDTTVVERILAMDFVGVAPNGTFTDKAKELANAKEDNGNTVSNHQIGVRVRFYGDTAVAQGRSSWVRRAGEPRCGIYVWTDTWVKRDGHWQIVAAEDVLVPDAVTK